MLISEMPAEAAEILQEFFEFTTQFILVCEILEQ